MFGVYPKADFLGANVAQASWPVPLPRFCALLQRGAEEAEAQACA